jgi:hypothetical protein
MSEATDLLDDQVDGFGAAIGYAAGVEEGEHLLAPGPGSPELSSSAATGHKWNPPVSDPWIRARSPRVLRCTTVTRVVDASGDPLRVLEQYGRGKRVRQVSVLAVSPGKMSHL